MILTNEERHRFILYLQEMARDNYALAKQMDALPGTEKLAQKYRAEALAAQVIVQMLEKTESVTVG